MNKMHFCLHFNSARQQWTKGWRSTEEGVPIGLRSLRREYHINGDSISRGHWQSFPPLRESVEGSNVFSAYFSVSCLQENESWFFWVFTGTTPTMCCTPICQEASQARRVPTHSKNRAHVKGQGLQNEGTNHQVLHHLQTECPASREHEEASFFTLFMEFTRQLLRILSCFRAKHASKISISFVLTQH